jgi:uncharacterized OsmC-like protein
VVLNLTMHGSVKAGTIDAGSDSIDTIFEIESSEDSEKVKEVLRLARQGCWARRMLEQPTTFNDTLLLNGKEETL